MDFKKLREKHAQFIYEGFKVEQENENLKVTFDFLLTPDIRFKPQVIFPNVSKTKDIDNLVFNLGMVELLSYWKAACPPKIIIKAGYLDEEQIKFWKKLLIKGLGEFFYINKIDFTQKDLFVFETASHSSSGNVFNGDLKDRDLVLVGGGKDSAVTLESISQKGKEFNCLLLNPTEAAVKMAEVGGCKNPIIIKRTIDPKLLKLNAQGYLNGHTPFSAYLAFLSVFTGVLYDYKNLVVSNEASSNEGNVTWLHQEINHQYSKTSEFEKDFRNYSKNYLALNANYYSFLRSFGELKISEIFSKMEKYHKIFRSCNRGSKQGVWCGECPKCVSTYLLLYPFLGKKTDEIFGKNLLDDESLEPIIKGLLRENNVVKPFECVATVDEIRTAISLIKQKVLILGFGREGKITLDYFRKNFPKTEVGIADKNDGKNYLERLKDYDVIIKSPGIPYLPEIKKAQKQGKIITSATNIFFQKCPGMIIGVTGTKGKSTTASLIYEVLKIGGMDAHLIGNIGKPALYLLDQLNENSIVVYELSSFQLEGLNKSPHIAVITNLYPEHLDHHGNFEDYRQSKFNITKFQTEKDYLICNKDISVDTKAQRIPFTQNNSLDDTAPAKIVGELFKIPQEKINQAIKNFKPLPHRLELVGEFKGIKFYNDSLATIPQATIGALQALGENVETLIAGGFDRGIDYAILGEAIGKSNIKTLILFPDTGKKISEAVKSKIQSFNVSSMQDAVELAFKHTSLGKIALLSPASSSFNLFKDYADRGEQFKKYVTSL
ncbi:MAG: UDP-N-acetylmuramoyl-L-alanine--D-glutamate ligase [Candidatus Daviesbacteria bacterium]|nr:UDP-N-acetylmuramoyl-L-alanine--D-glutamate ligase [Candidatus Daviesbacteria bacterium]